MTRLGILGGGQLAQMLTQAAISLGVETAIFDRASDTPAARLTHYQLAGAWDDAALLDTFADWCDVITLENEFVDAGVLRALAAASRPVYPTAATLDAIQDKLMQKQRMPAAGIPLPDFAAAETPEAVRAAGARFGWPLLLKARRESYDGYGNRTVGGPEAVDDAWVSLGGHQGRRLLAEAFVPFVRELAVMIVRGRDGETRAYPVVETVQRDHVCHIVRAPAPNLTADAHEAAVSLARRAVEAVDGVGVFGVELFALADGTILYNEMAPRPHNSGHYTIEACVTSQFENHIRAVLGWPLGDTHMIAPAAVMVNLLGARDGDADAEAARAALTVAGAHVHLYGKRQVRRRRKMGHITVVGSALDIAEAAALEAAERIQL